MEGCGKQPAEVVVRRAGGDQCEEGGFLPKDNAQSLRAFLTDDRHSLMSVLKTALVAERLRCAVKPDV